MNTAAINSYSADILQNLGAISGNEDALARLSKYLRRLVKEQKKDPTLFSEEEFFARVEEANKGALYELKESDTIESLIKRVV